ncbi:UNVERIFIED_CONTAM: hypothetical protein GTU68_030932 [Idotea baltica]|nr:hypothetical protein [Idotea baltica]
MDKEIDLKGSWNELHFKNNAPIVLELACGRGEYSLGLAKLYPSKNFIGVDIKGARIWRGAVNAQNDKLDNIAFLRTRIEQLELFFGNNEVDEIWITFPDPFLGKENRRLTANSFLNKYKNILASNAIMHLKTDSQELYRYTKEVLENRPDIKILVNNPDIYSTVVDPTLEIKTYYEKMHLAKGKKITYLQFTFI